MKEWHRLGPPPESPAPAPPQPYCWLIWLLVLPAQCLDPVVTKREHLNPTSPQAACTWHVQRHVAGIMQCAVQGSPTRQLSIMQSAVQGSPIRQLSIMQSAVQGSPTRQLSIMQSAVQWSPTRQLSIMQSAVQRSPTRQLSIMQRTVQGPTRQLPPSQEGKPGRRAAHTMS